MREAPKLWRRDDEPSPSQVQAMASRTRENEQWRQFVEQRDLIWQATVTEAQVAVETYFKALLAQADELVADLDSQQREVREQLALVEAAAKKDRVESDFERGAFIASVRAAQGGYETRVTNAEKAKAAAEIELARLTQAHQSVCDQAASNRSALVSDFQESLTGLNAQLAAAEARAMAAEELAAGLERQLAAVKADAPPARFRNVESEETTATLARW